METSPARRSATVITLAALAAVLAGCSPLSTSPSTAPAAASTSSPSAAPDATPTSNTVVIDCDLVLSDADAAGLTPSLKPIPSFAPAAGTLGAAMVEQGGRPCGWGAESAASLEAVVAIPTPAGLAAAKKAASSTGQVTDAGQSDAAYFEVTNGVGRAQIFMGSYWIEVASPAFTTADQAESVYSLVIHDLRSAGG